jgi:hypothetical protein
VISGLWAGWPVSGPLVAYWLGWPICQRTYRRWLRLGFPLTRSRPFDPPHAPACGSVGVAVAGGGRPVGRRWSAEADLQAPGGVPPLLLSPFSVFVHGLQVRRRALPTASRWPAFRGRRWGTPARLGSRCRAGSLGGS